MRSLLGYTICVGCSFLLFESEDSYGL